MELPGFKDEIQALKGQLKSHLMKESFAFYGSSSIRLWENLTIDMAPRNVINLGFGGSSYGWMAHYYHSLFADHEHDHVILYAGDNDHSSGHKSTKILENFRRLTHEIWLDNPNTNVHVISIKPSPQRLHQMTKIRETNDVIKNSIVSYKYGHWVNVFDEMLTEGMPRPELFVDDMLHMNADGYAIWKKVLLAHFAKLGI